jgi:DNA-directed RNA polymerase sigma subunit (sigma70/sigma32)
MGSTDDASRRSSRPCSASAHQLDPEKKLRREGIGRETVSRGYLPRSRTDATFFLHRVAADVDRARGKLIEANLRLVVSMAKRPRRNDASR